MAKKKREEKRRRRKPALMDNALPQFAESKDIEQPALLCCFVAHEGVEGDMFLCKVVKPSFVPSAPVT